MAHVRGQLHFERGVAALNQASNCLAKGHMQEARRACSRARLCVCVCLLLYMNILEGGLFFPTFFLLSKIIINNNNNNITIINNNNNNIIIT